MKTAQHILKWKSNPELNIRGSYDERLAVLKRGELEVIETYKILRRKCKVDLPPMTASLTETQTDRHFNSF